VPGVILSECDTGGMTYNERVHCRLWGPCDGWLENPDGSGTYLDPCGGGGDCR
jgi:hypothetical protein